MATHTKSNLLLIVSFILLGGIMTVANRMTDTNLAYSRAMMILEESGTSFIESDKNGKIIAWLGASKEIFGYTKDQASGISIHELIKPVDRSRHISAYNMRMNEPAESGHEFKGQPAIDSNGVTIFIDGIVMAHKGGALGIFQKSKKKNSKTFIKP